MNKRFKLSTGLLLGVVLVLSVMNSTPSVTAIAGPNTMIHTGDHFTYTEDSTNTQNNTRYFTMYNASALAPYPFMHGDDELSYDFTHSTGTSDVGFIRQDPNLPPLGAMDTWISIKSDLTSQPGSYHIDYQNSTNSLPWPNSGNNTFTTDGQHQGNDQSMGLSSNDTYSVIFPEMTQTQINITDQMGGGNPFQNFAGFNGIISLNWAQKTAGSDVYMINGNSVSVNTVTVSMMFSGLWTQTGFQDIWLGPQGDPNTPVANVSTSNSLYFAYTLNYIYDASNTLLLQTSTQSTVEVHMDFPSQIVPLYSQNAGYLWDAQIQQTATGLYNDYHVSVMSTADSFYGNIRPTSTADVLRLHDGDFLTYNWEQGSNSGVDAYFNVQDGLGNYHTDQANINVYNDFNGNLTLDVFRHNANSFEAVLGLLGNQTSSYYQDGSHTDNQGTTYDQTQDFQQNNPHSTYFGLIQLGSDATRDITPFFETQMHMDLSYLDNCNNNNGDCLNLNFPRDLNPTGSVNITNYYINLVQEQPGQYPVINGNTYYEFNATEQTQLYSLTYSGTTQIPIGPQQNQVWINVPITVQADAKQSFYYDNDTGALVSQDQSVNGNVTINYSGSNTLYNDQGQPYTATVTIKLNIYYNSYQSMLLTTHPYYYDTQPTMPVPPTTSSTPTSNTTTPTTTSTTSSEPQTSSSTGGAAGLPLPTPVLPIAFGLFSMVVIVRKRK